MTFTPVLYGAPLSPFVRKVAIVLEEKNIPYSWQPLPPHSDNADFKCISPLGKIPAYRDERCGLADSSVICQYLEKIHPDPALYPADAVEFARALWFEEYFDSGLIRPLQTIYFEEYFNPRYRARVTDRQKLASAYEDSKPYLAYLNEQIKPGQWLAGSMFSIADISVTVAFDNLFIEQMEFNITAYPNLQAHIQKVYARPSAQKVSQFMHQFIAALPKKPAA